MAIRLPMAVAMVALALLSPAAAAAGLVIEDVALTVSPAEGESLDLEAVLVRPDDGKSHPLAVITHGSPRDGGKRRGMTARALVPQAQEFARRGWAALVVMRRGFGTSEGDWVETNGDCRRPNFPRAGRVSAEDLRWAIAAAAELPHVDGSTVISVGVSAGGFATIALTADPPPNLVAAISFAGGRGSPRDDTICDEAALVGAFAEFGRTSRVPMLWVYAENDRFFSPAFARSAHDAFTGAGGTARLVVSGPFGTDGHSLFTSKGIPHWAPLVETFLRERGLTRRSPPIAIDPPRLPPPAGLSAGGREAFADYLAAPDHKAFVMAPSGAYGWRSGQRSEEEAVTGAEELCRPRPDEACVPVAIGNAGRRRVFVRP